MDDPRIETLFELLERAGWRREATRIVAPRETMWLDCPRPWSQSVEEFRAALKASIEQIRENQKNFERRSSLTNTLLDKVSLNNCLDSVYCSDNGM